MTTHTAPASLPAALPTAAAARAARLADAAYPTPSTAQRGPVACLHWQHGLDVDPALVAVVVDQPDAPRETPAILAEAHAELLDPAGLQALDRPSPLGREVLRALTASPSWPALCDASTAHPLIARESVVALAAVVDSALRAAGATKATDTRATLADLDAARAALLRAREAERAATTSEERREALRATVAARTAEERAEAAQAVAEGLAARAGDALAGQGRAIEAIAEAARQRSAATHALSAALGAAVGVGGQVPIADDVVRALTPDVVKMLRAVGALRAALAKGRASRHLRGREGMVGLRQGGLDDAADLTPLALAALSGHLGTPMAALTRLALVESRADVVEKGGGIANEGDVVVVVDKSGSMCGAREQWAGALALAVVLEARADGRSVALVTYDGTVRHSIRVDTAARMAAAVLACGEDSGGANNERAALLAAQAELARMPHSGDPADVLLVTDGQWDAANLAGIDLDRARLRGVFIGGAAPVGCAFGSTWEVRSSPIVGESGDLAVEIASVIV